MEMSSDSLRLIALDGYRLALRTARIEGEAGADKNVVVPARSLLEVARILPDDGESKARYPSAGRILAP